MVILLYDQKLGLFTTTFNKNKENASIIQLLNNQFEFRLTVNEEDQK